MKKGMSYTNAMIVEDIKSFGEFSHLLYHTRISSAGKISTPNCHPFLKDHVCLAMNGTESSFAAMARAIDKTDTELVLDYLVALKKPIDVLSALTANYVGFDHGKAFFVNNGGMRELEILKEGDAFIVGSSFPATVKSELVKNTVWRQGDELKIKDTITYIPTRNTRVNPHNVKGLTTDDIESITKGKQYTFIPASTGSTIWDDVKDGYEKDKQKGLLE